MLINQLSCEKSANQRLNANDAVHGAFIDLNHDGAVVFFVFVAFDLVVLLVILLVVHFLKVLLLG